MDADAPTIPLTFNRRTESEMQARAQSFHNEVSQRRSVRHFSRDAIPMDVVETCVHSAGTAPSGANKQPWQFVLVTDPRLKKEIRVAAEQEEEAGECERPLNATAPACGGRVRCQGGTLMAERTRNL